MLIGGAYAPRRPERLNIYRYYLRSCVTSAQLYIQPFLYNFRDTTLTRANSVWSSIPKAVMSEELRNPFCFYFTVFKKAFVPFFLSLIFFL